jgi:hypothetical protein
MAGLGCVMTEGVERGGMAPGGRGPSVQGHAPGGHALRTFPGGARGRPNGRHLSAFAGMAGAIGLLLLSGCGSLPRWFASASQAEQQQELRRMDEQHVTLIQRLEQQAQRLEERQRRLDQQTRRLDQQTRRLSGWRRAREKEQRLLQVELGKLERERQQRERQQ